MPEIKKNVIIKKITQKDVLFTITPYDNPSVSKVIHLTKRIPSISLPMNWAVSVLVNDGLYSLFKNGRIGFDDPQAVIQAGQEYGVFFSEYLDFEIKEDHSEKIFAAIKTGVPAHINKAIKEYGTDAVKDLVFDRVEELPQASLRALEKLWNIQLIIAEDSSV